MKTETYKIPEYLMPYFINGDEDCASEEEIAMANEWLEKSGVQCVSVPSDEDYQVYFDDTPAFGEPCDVVDCVCVLEW